MAKTNKKTSPVKIVDSKLILSLPEALEPVVWQMDLEQAQSSAFTIKEDKKTKSFSLVFKSQGGETEEIAPFSDKQDALDILMATSEALQNAEGKINSGRNAATSPSSAPASSPKNEKGDKLGAFLAVALIIMLILAWTILSSAPEKLARLSNDGTGYNSASTAAPRESSGVPVSADDFLSNN